MRESSRPTAGGGFGSLQVQSDRLRREQVKRVAFVEDLTNVSGHATNRQLFAYDVASGTWLPVDPPDIVWTAPSPPTATTSPAYAPKDTINVTGFSVTIGTVGSSGTTAVLLKNGSSIATVTVASSSHYNNAAVSPSVSFTGRSDYMQVQLTSVGTGADKIGGGIELG